MVIFGRTETLLFYVPRTLPQIIQCNKKNCTPRSRVITVHDRIEIREKEREIYSRDISRYMKGDTCGEILRKEKSADRRCEAPPGE